LLAARRFGASTADDQGGGGGGVGFMALYHFSGKVLSRSSRNTVRAIAYRSGCKLYDEKTGESFNYEYKAVEHVELVLPKDAPAWAVEIQKLMEENRKQGVQAFVDKVEAAEKRVDSQVWREFEFALHRELTKEQNMALAREFVQDEICSHSMAAQLNFHFDEDKVTGEAKPHCHVTATMRYLEEDGLSAKKERAWNSKGFLCDLRVKWEEYSNTCLKLHGHDVQIDHRSHIERGIEMEPQPKLGRNILEQEQRVQKLEGREVLSSPVTDKGKAFHEAQLRNLYRIMRNPETVLDIVTKHHATFMWADVQSILHRYVDDAPLLERLEDKLKNSKDLLTLRSEGINPEGLPLDVRSEGKGIYTTRRMLTAEKSLIETAEGLGRVSSHGVDSRHTESAINKANEDLKEHGGLSEDQVKAIHHLVDEGQIKCVVGIAGAGKTTALGVCHEIWKDEGYNVYGLTPTGKAAQNLEQSGIESTTLHKFLKSYEAGRCQYGEKSVLVLDEAGMVDMERFGKLLGAVKELGVKLIVVGDGAQLQPVEAGPAFRLVTTRLGKVELNTVLRQKEGWQREATVLFGRQETKEAIQAYTDKGHVHIVKEDLPSWDKASDAVKLYEISHRVSSLMYREMVREVSQENPETSNHYEFIRNHQDFEKYADWKGIERKAALSIFENAEAARPVLEERCLDPLNIALVLSDKFQSKETQKEEAIERLKSCKLDHLIGIQKPAGTGVDVREQAKEALIQSWHREFSPDKSSIMLAYSNRDVNDLNQTARSLLKESGHIAKEELTYAIKKEIEDDFGRKRIVKEEKGFSKGDRIVFTRNNYWLGVKNGTMGTITNLDQNKVHVKLDEGKELFFSPNLKPYFDQGWAVTIHKSQGTTVDRTFVLASYEMTQNLAYVAMTRHREDVQVYGSSLDFWRSEKLPQILAKSGEKLSAADYLDAESLNNLMQRKDNLLTKIFDRVSNELEAMGAVTKQAFWNVADHFLGIKREKEIRIVPEGVREEVRAGDVLKKERVSEAKESPPIPDARKIFESLTKMCEKYLYTYMARDNVPFTSEKRERIPLQAERAANFIFYAHTLRGAELSEQETRLYLLRAKYELDRLPQIKEKLRENWQERGIFDEKKDPLIIHMIAERRASIEGRFYFEAKQAGLKPSSHIPQWAEAEFKMKRAEAKTLAVKLGTQYSLSTSAAAECARNALRYQETHVAKPTDIQMTTMAEIAHQIEEKHPDYLEREVGSHNLAYMRRMNGDDMLRERCYEERHTITHEYEAVKMQEKALLEVQKQQIQQEVSRQKERGFEMGM
jgi:Ti-type conjugative transfer relaxase TraA